MKLPELHDHLFDVLCIIDDICKKNNLRYYLTAGTELGAVREGDFIPWDDDMDLMVLAEDYLHFKEVMVNQLPEHLHFMGPEDLSPKFYGLYARIYDDRWILRKEGPKEKYYDNKINRVGTDIFFFSKVPNSPIRRKLLKIKNKFLCIEAGGHRYGALYYDDKVPFIKKRCIDIVRTVGGFQKVEQILNRWYKMVFKYNDLEEYDYRFPYNFIFRDMKFYDSAIFKAEDKTAKIRGREFPIPGGYDKELTIHYGDYMTPKKDNDYFTQHLDEEDRWQAD